MLKTLITKLDRYVVSEFWLPLASGLGVITGVWLGIDKFKEVFKLLARSGASFDKGIVIIGLQIPEILSMTIPIGLLLAAFLVFQKLSGQSEIIAMRAAGISFLRVLQPVLIIGCLCAMATFVLSEFVVPIASPLARKIYTLSLYQKPIPTKSTKDFTYIEKNMRKKLKRIFYVRSFDDDVLEDVVILDFTKKDFLQVFTANEGEWSPQRGGWVLREGNSNFIKRDIETGGGAVDIVSNFNATFIPSGLNPNKILKKISKFRDMNFLELYKFIDLHEGGNIDTGKLNEAKTRFHNKFAYPFACLFLAIIGAVLGVTGRRRTVNWGYIFLGLVVFVFYMSQTIFTSFGDSGKMDAFVAVWLPNFILALMTISSVLYRTKN